MSSFSGFANLRTPRDLLMKLQHDMVRITDSPGDEYAAFDFFVTAEHIIDWLHPTSKQNRRELRDNNPLLRVVSHLANGAKHFDAKASHHRSVLKLANVEYDDSSCSEPGVPESELVVRLEPIEADALGGSEITTVVLSYRVLAYWQAELP